MNKDPHLIMQYNISPETLIRENVGNEERPFVIPVDLDKMINKEEDTSNAKELNYALPASGVCFSREHEGLFPRLMSELYAKRKEIKKEALRLKEQRERVATELRRRGIQVKDL